MVISSEFSIISYDSLEESSSDFRLIKILCWDELLDPYSRHEGYVRQKKIVWQDRSVPVLWRHWLNFVFAIVGNSTR